MGRREGEKERRREGGKDVRGSVAATQGSIRHLQHVGMWQRELTRRLRLKSLAARSCSVKSKLVSDAGTRERCVRGLPRPRTGERDLSLSSSLVTEAVRELSATIGRQVDGRWKHTYLVQTRRHNPVTLRIVVNAMEYAIEERTHFRYLRLAKEYSLRLAEA